jgi:hypothetical protein
VLPSGTDDVARVKRAIAFWSESVAGRGQIDRFIAQATGAHVLPVPLFRDGTAFSATRQHGAPTKTHTAAPGAI